MRSRFRVTAKVVNAADYGVPQKRQRMLIVGV
ncbi:MAG: DNA cytosine methyltransferase [Acidimicrobiales bacterium]